MKLLAAGASPFVAKVAMAARFAGIEIETQNVDASTEAPELLAANPLGKIPALVLDDGSTLYDSRLITRYLDRQSGGKLVSAADPLPIERMEAHCDGIADCAVAGIYEKRMRPEDKWHQPWIDRQWAKVERGLDNFPGSLPSTGDQLDLGGISLAATLAYLDLRYADVWRNERDGLVNWLSEFSKDHPELAELLPHG